MTLPKIEIRPNSISDTAMVSINGHQCGEMWMTDRGCCYKHTDRDFTLAADHVEFLATIMRGVELLGLGASDEKGQ